MEEKENSREAKRFTCDNIKCPCTRAARRQKPRPTVGKGKHEKVWFTEELEQEVQWDANNPAYKDCCHYQVDDNGKWLKGTRTKGKGIHDGGTSDFPWKKILIALAAIAAIAIVWACWPEGGGGGEPGNGNPEAAKQKLEAVIKTTFASSLSKKQK